ncbi:MAG: hypothetical protein DIU73_008390 [Actinomycetes bacterium]|nr:MAG: hypothetical protein DIU73_02635 [Actinomycetota bacterium]
MDDSGLFEGLLAGSFIALVIFLLVTVLPLFLLIAVLVRYFQATGDIRKLLREVQELKLMAEEDYRAKRSVPGPPAPPQLPSA